MPGKNKNHTNKKSKQKAQRADYVYKKYLYSPDEHIKLLDSTVGEGYSYLVFCGKANIKRSTFFEWREKYKEFNEAYEISLMKGCIKWDLNTAFVGKDFNYNLWSSVMRMRYKHVFAPLKLHGKESSKQLMKMLLVEFGKSELQDEQFDRLHSIIKTQIDAIEIHELKKDFHNHIREQKK